MQIIPLEEVLTAVDAAPKADSGATVLATGEIETDGFDVAAVTWPAAEGASDMHIEIRSRSGETWSGWYEVHDDGHAPDPGTAEAADARRGTDPVVVPGSQAVELRIEAPGGEVPAGLELSLIDPGEATTDTSASPAVASRIIETNPPQPIIHTRAAWGADESLREQTAPLYGEIRGAFVHQTAGTNAYTESQVPAILRGIYEYHVTGRGWRDIGYNFFVDRFGRIWEGRWGGIGRAVVGAHAEGYNSYSVGVAAIGDFTATKPNSGILDAFTRVFAWKFGPGLIDPHGEVLYPGQEYQPTIAGHRDVGVTECPGELLYAQLYPLRYSTNGAMEPLHAPRHDFSRDRLSDMIGRGSNGKLFLIPGRRDGILGTGTVGARVQIGAGSHWYNYTAIVRIGEFNGDRHSDLIIREHSSGKLFYQPGRGDGTFGNRIQIGAATTWNNYTALLGVGDFNGDRHNDMIGRSSGGALYLIPGRSDGTVRNPIRIGTATTWGKYTAFVGIGDFNGDGHNDLIARENNGKLFYFPGRSNGTLGARVRIGAATTWGAYTALLDVGDFNGDGHHDMAGRSSNGALYLIPGRRNGTFGARVQLGTNTTWGTYAVLV